MRVPFATLAVASLTLLVGACGADAGSSDGSPTRGTSIRTAPLATTTSEPATTPLPTAYATLPSVTLAPPDWAPTTWRTDDVEEFTTLVSEELEALGADASVVVERGYALLANGTRIELTALATRLAALPVESWRGEITSFLVTALKPAVPDDYAAFSDAAPLLRVRVGELEALGVDPAEVVLQERAPGLLALLVLAGPERTSLVSPAQVDLWGRPTTELFAIATAQTLAAVEEPVVDGALTSLTDDSDAAARILDPGTVVPEIDPDGLLILVPNADVFLAVRVTRRLDEDLLAGLIQQAVDGYGEREDPVSDALYWWHEGVLEVVPVEDGEIVYPEALADIVR